MDLGFVSHEEAGQKITAQLSKVFNCNVLWDKDKTFRLINSVENVIGVIILDEVELVDLHSITCMLINFNPVHQSMDSSSIDYKVMFLFYQDLIQNKFRLS
ncbi:MAG: hypothetical protein ACRCXZ_06985 [Patescibacteria group bacterium]